jgi:GNAT superfamily N-acetyltransferase
MPNFPNLEPIELTANAPDMLEEIYRLRVDAWMTTGLGLGMFPNGMWIDEGEERHRHWVVFDDGRLVAAARLSIHERLCDVPCAHLFTDLHFPAAPPFGSINRLVVHPDARSRGLSKKLDQIRIEAAAAAGCRTIVAYWSRVTGLARYHALERQGFVRISDFDFRHELPTGAVTALALSL